MSQNSQQMYSKFSKQRDFKHITSSPHYPKSNGQIERTIQTIKKNIKKALINDTYLELLAVRTAPGPENNTPPVTLLYNRTITSINLLPSTNKEVNKENKKLVL